MERLAGIRRPVARWLLPAASLVALALAGCAHVRPLDPSAGPIELEENEGILVVHVRTEVPIFALETTAGAVAKELEPGEHLLLRAVTAGEFHWNRLVQQKGVGWELFYRIGRDDERFGFRVEAGKINYPGVIIARRPDPIHIEGWVVRTETALVLDVVNRSTAMLEYFASRHAALLERYPMRYSGWGRDDFIERYLEAQRRLSGGPGPPAAAQ